MKIKLSDLKNYEVFQGERALRLIKPQFKYESSVHLLVNKVMIDQILDKTMSVIIDRDTNKVYTQLTEVLKECGLL